MSSNYQVLARKWRPHDFETMVGQDHVVTALTRALSEKRLHHAYLFTGTRGVGKTTISRIFAKALNCQGVDGHGDITAKPCGVCPACRAIDEGRYPDYIEMDAASNRSVEDITALLDKAMYAPTQGRFKIYMIDEVHMMTTTAFNAMLKTLEEPPEYIKFILATTDPQKVPITVLSRCLQFNLRNMTPSGIVSHMEHILNEEKIAYEEGALRLLANGARGSMRDGLSLLDQAIAYCGSRIETQPVRQMLGMSSEESLVGILDALAAGDGAAMIAIADNMSLMGVSFAQALRDLAGLLHRLALLQRIPGTRLEEEVDAELLTHLLELFTPEEIQLYYQIVIHGRNDLGLAPDEYAGFTMTLLRLLAFKPSGLRGRSEVLARDAGHVPAITKRAMEAPARTIQPAQNSAPLAPAVPASPKSPAAGGAERAGATAATAQSVPASQGAQSHAQAPLQVDDIDLSPPWGE